MTTASAPLLSIYETALPSPIPGLTGGTAKVDGRRLVEPPISDVPSTWNRPNFSGDLELGFDDVIIERGSAVGAAVNNLVGYAGDLIQ
jgi:hypothetical protein